MFIFLHQLWICVWNNECKWVWKNILLIIIIIFYVSRMCCLNITFIASYNYLVPRSNVINWQLASLLMFYVLEIELFSYWVRLWSEVFLSPIWAILVSSSWSSWTLLSNTIRLASFQPLAKIPSVLRNPHLFGFIFRGIKHICVQMLSQN